MTSGDQPSGVDLLDVSRDDGIACVTMNRPHRSNALSYALQRALAESFTALANDSEIRAIILTGAGSRAFSAGLDLKELEAGRNLIVSDVDPVAAIASCPKPVIAAVNGVAMTGGLELALACDVIMAAECAAFADTHVRMGVFPGWGMSQRLSRRIGVNRALEMSLGGNFVDARTAEAWGLADHVVAAGELPNESRKLAAAIAGGDSAFVQRYKALIRQGAAMPLCDALAFEREEALRQNRRLDPSVVGGRASAKTVSQPPDSGNRGLTSTS